MKKNIQTIVGLVFLSLSSAVLSQTTNPSPYCAAGFDDGEMGVDVYISKVEFGSLVNTSGEGQAPGQHYIFYNNLTPTEFTKGNTYTMKLTHSGSVVHYVAAYIDFNQNNVFEESERVLHYKLEDDLVPNPCSATVTIPQTALTGTTRMRIIAIEDDMYTWEDNNQFATPCTAYNGGLLDWGETEDYTIKIVGGSLGIEASFSEDEVNLVPNPAQDYVLVNDAWKGATLEILSINGKVLMTIPSINVDKIDISELNESMVVFKVTGDKGVFTQKLAITK